MTAWRTIAIVGGGFSGTVVACNLLESGLTEPTRILLIERQNRIGPGLAYARCRYPFLLNVPAGRMSARSADPAEFLRFARVHLPQAEAEDFLPRALYGDYLQEKLGLAEIKAPPHVRLQRIAGEVESIRHMEGRGRLVLELGLTSLTADQVVLACGNPPPTALAALAPLDGHSAYIPDPWSADLCFNTEQTVFIIGTGLSMADVVTASTANCSGAPTIHALSRHGLVPPRQTTFKPEQLSNDKHNALLSAASSLRELAQAIRQLAKQAQQCGGDWREAINFARNVAPTVWKRLSQRDRARFLRHLRPYWDVHRHRLPPAVYGHLRQLQYRGSLHVHSGFLEEAAPLGDKVRVTWRPRGQQQNRSLLVDAVINCTGPNYNVRNSCRGLLANLVQAGLASPDHNGLGLRTSESAALLDAQGRASTCLFYVGPMLRADHWEATAVGELRVHAERLAQHLASQENSRQITLVPRPAQTCDARYSEQW